MNYFNKYLKYKSKYIMLKKQIGKGSTSIEVYSEPTILEPNTSYKFTGLISCIGIIIKKGDFDDETGIYKFNEGVAVHFIDGTYFKDNEFTTKGNEILNQMEETIKKWNNDDTIDIELIYSPDMHSKMMKDSSKLIKELKDWFKSLKEWTDHVYFREIPSPRNREDSGHISSYNFHT